MTKEECLGEIVLWSNIIATTWIVCMFCFIFLSFGLIKLKALTDPPALILASIPLILIFGLIYPMDKINTILRKEGLTYESRRTTTSKK
jgi:Na+-driven multidrug efflux pump